MMMNSKIYFVLQSIMVEKQFYFLISWEVQIIIFF